MSLLAKPCINIGVLSHFNSLGSDGTVYGSQILNGIKKAQKEIKSTCFNINKIDIGENLADLRKIYKRNHLKNDLFIGLGQSNKVVAIKDMIGKKILFSPTATSNTLKGLSNIFLTSGINESLARGIAFNINKSLKNIAIIYDPANIYSVDLKTQILAFLRIKASIYKNMEKIKHHHDGALLLLDEDISAQKISELDNTKSVNNIIGVDSWGPKSIYLKKVFKKIKHIKSIEKYYTFNKNKNFESDLEYYSYHSLYLAKTQHEKCFNKSFGCLSKQMNKLPTKMNENYLDWEVKKDILYER